jgi:sugar/nucleoside kinase (ribokinase family)
MTPAARSSVDYLIIGHVSADRIGDATALGGTAAYAGRTAAALGMSVGVVTSAGSDIDLEPMKGLRLQVIPAPQSTSFENCYDGAVRHQQLHARALDLDLEAVPSGWRNAQVVHLAPIADEVDPTLATAFPQSMVVATPQGWMRRWDASGRVRAKGAEELAASLPRAEAAVVSREDFGGQRDVLAILLDRYRLLVVTDGPDGADVYQDGKMRHEPAPKVEALDPTGCGDIFAACFFSHYQRAKQPAAAARFANRLAAASVTRAGQAGVPGKLEVANALQGVAE